MSLPPDTTDRRPALRPPRFGLRTLFLLITLLCALLATMQAAGPLGAAVLLLFVLSVIAHVAGASLGKQLRENGSSQPTDEFGRPYAARPMQRARLGDFAPPTPLSARTGPGWVMLVLTTVAVAAGSMAGGFLFSGDPGMAGVRSAVLGSISVGVLAGIGCFAVSTFLKSLAGSVWHAHRQERR